MAEQTQAVESQATGQAPNTEQPNAKTAPGAQDGDKGKETASTGTVSKVEELPEWAQTEIKNLRKEAADRRKAASDAESAAKIAEETNLAEQKRWQELAEKRREERDALTPKAELADKLSALVLEQYTAELKSWPEQVRNMAPADEADVLAKLDWMKRAKPLAVELMEGKPPVAGNGRRPVPVGAANTSKAAETARTEWSKAAARRYR